MTVKISKWGGNSVAVRLPSEVLKFLSLHVGDLVELLQKENSIEFKIIDDEKSRIIAEAKRIKKHYVEDSELDASLADGP